MTTASDDTSGVRLRAEWDALCGAALTAVDAAQAGARSESNDRVVRYLDRQRHAVRSLQRLVDARRSVPDAGHGTGILHDIPPELGEPEYAAVMDALDAVRDSWSAGLGAAGWDWDRGFPSDWPTSTGDRLRAGIFFRRK